MSNFDSKDVIIRFFDITDGTGRTEEEANDIVGRGYELFSSTMASIHTSWICNLVLVFKKKK